MCCPRPHPPPPPPRLNRPAGFWFPSCCDSSSALLSSLSRSLRVTGVPPPQICSPSPQLFRCCCLNLIQVVSPSPRAVVLFFKKRQKNERGDAAASTALSATRRGEQRRPGQQERGWSFTMLRGLVLQSRRSERDEEQEIYI